MIRYIRPFLELLYAYQLWGNLVGGSTIAKVLVGQFIQPQIGDRILDIGCGPGSIVGHLPQCNYLGFDLNPSYIDSAKRRFPNAQFVCDRVSRFSLANVQSFDIVLALGIVHHLDNAEARQLFQTAYDALKPNGKLVTLDGVYVNGQSRTARWLLAKDRGEYVRSEQEYVGIASQVFSNIRPNVRHDLLRIPYTHLILECIR